MTPLRPERDAGVTPDLVLEVWYRRKWIAILVFVAGVAATITATASLPDLYRASTTVLVDRQEVSEAFVRASVTAELETRIQTIHQRVTSRERLSDLIARLSLYPELRGVQPIESIVDRMRNDDIRLQLKGVEQSTGRSTTIAFSLSYTGRDPQSVAEVANTLAGFYIDENTQSRERQAARTAEFLRGQLAEVKQELDEQEQQTTAFTLQHTDELPEQLQANLSAIERLNTQLRLNGEYQLRVMERRERLEQELTGARTAVAGEQTPAAELMGLRRQLAELRRRFSDEYPDVKRMTAQIAALEAELAAPKPESQATISSDPAARVRRNLAAGDEELRLLREQEASLRRMIAAYETRIANAPRRQQEIEQLSRGYGTTRERYQTLLKQYEAAQLAARLEQGQSIEQFRVLDSALPPLHPAAPNRLWLAMMGLIGSLALAVGAVVAIERLDTTFHNADDLRAFADVPMLAAIRQIPTVSAARQRQVRLAVVATSVVVGLALIVAGTYYVAGGNEQIVRLMARGAA